MKLLTYPKIDPSILRTPAHLLGALSLSLVLVACGGDDNDDEINDLEARVDTLESRLSTVETSSGALGDSLDAIDLRLSQLETGNAAIEADLIEISALLDEIEARLSILEGVNMSRYEITLVNVTANQPLAPAAVILHDDAYYAWDIGAPASVGLETLAESGSPAVLLDEASYALDSGATDGILMPGNTTSIELETVWREDLAITVASMPVNTNDAFSGTTAWNIANLTEGMSLTALLPIYDAGTEANTESAASVPGPAAGGEGFNADRDDLADVVTRHMGVVTSDDGLATSALDQSHRFDQGAVYVTVTRLESVN